MQIRRATPGDLQQIDELLAASQLPLLPPEVSVTNTLVALDQGSVVGGIALEVAVRHGLLRSAVVSAVHRGRGIGASLVRGLIARASELGLRDLYLLTENAPDYFAGFGFCPVARDDAPEPIRATREFREQCPDSAELMRLGLEPRL